MAKIDIRPHGRWKALDCLWLAPFVLLASLVPSWRRQYWSTYVTLSVLTGTLYTPKGREPKPSTMRHEEYHLRQARKDGRLKWGLRYALSTRWRIWYEAEAWAVEGESAEATVDALRSMYFVRWPRQHVMGLVLWARSRQRVVGLITEEADYG